MTTTKKDPFRPAERTTRCPQCKEWLGWNTEDGLTGQLCQCGHIFTGHERPSKTIAAATETPKKKQPIVTAKADYSKCVECYRESITRLIKGFATYRGFVPGVSAEQAAELRAEALKQIADWGESANAETAKHKFHTSRN